MTPLLTMGIIAALSSVIGSAINAASTGITNDKNIELQKETNAQAQYNMEHAHQIEMADLKSAGLNPVLTATGGSGAPQASLNAPKAQAPQVDLSGVGSAIMGMAMMENQRQIQNAYQGTISAIASSKNANQSALAVAKNNFYNAKADALKMSLYNPELGKSMVHSSKFDLGMSKKELEEAKRILSYKWIK